MRYQLKAYDKYIYLTYLGLAASGFAFRIIYRIVLICNKLYAWGIHI